MIKASWEEAADYCEKVYGVWACREKDNEFFICPECGDYILKEDWDNFVECPICGFDWFEEEDEEFY